MNAIWWMFLGFLGVLTALNVPFALDGHKLNLAAAMLGMFSLGWNLACKVIDQME